MKIAVPYLGQLAAVDDRLLRLADFLGVQYETVELATASDPVTYLDRTVPSSCSCLVLNPSVIREWMSTKAPSAEFVAFLFSRFPHLLVHGLRVDDFDARMVAALSGGALQSVERVDKVDAVYTVADDSRDICGPFAGLSFGPVNPVDDRVFGGAGTGATVRRLISIGDRPFMAAVARQGSEVLFLAAGDVADLDTEARDLPSAEYFSRLLPQAMALRHVSGEGWRSERACASIVIDDPLLRKNYGFLNYESLLRLANAHNFHATIAFIPHNFRRNSARIIRMFLENPARLSICFHGNDHTEAEFAATDPALLNSLLTVAEARLDKHRQTTGLACDRVMVFPQGHFSVEAMRALKFHNFHAAVNTDVHTTQQPRQLTLRELATPAVRRYGGFPLFLRKSVRETEDQDIAFNIFFGRPVLIGEHHELFEHPECLVEIAERINAIAPDIRWADLATVVRNSTLWKSMPDGRRRVLAYSGSVRIGNDSSAARRYAIEWVDECDAAAVTQVLRDGAAYRGVEVDGSRLRVSAELAPGGSSTFSLVYPGMGGPVRNPGLAQRTHVLLRRRLSEARDNYLSRSPQLLMAARRVYQHLFN